MSVALEDPSAVKVRGAGVDPGQGYMIAGLLDLIGKSERTSGHIR